MMPVIIGIISGILVILFIALFRKSDRPVMYGLILSGIGFLYVGYTWSDTNTLIVTSGQAILFVLIALYGIKKLSILSAGYFLHGIWDLVYDLFFNSNLLPPHYDLFCLSIDFTMGLYLLITMYVNLKGSYTLS